MLTSFVLLLCLVYSSLFQIIKYQPHCFSFQFTPSTRIWSLAIQYTLLNKYTFLVFSPFSCAIFLCIFHALSYLASIIISTKQTKTIVALYAMDSRQNKDPSPHRVPRIQYLCSISLQTSCLCFPFSLYSRDSNLDHLLQCL